MDIDKLRVVNNRFQDCPAMMSDGRLVTDYRANVKINNQLKNQNNIKMDNHEYRQFLIHNSKRIMDSNKEVLSRLNNCNCKYK